MRSCVPLRISASAVAGVVLDGAYASLSHWWWCLRRGARVWKEGGTLHRVVCGCAGRASPCGWYSWCLELRMLGMRLADVPALQPAIPRNRHNMLTLSHRLRPRASRVPSRKAPGIRQEEERCKETSAFESRGATRHSLARTTERCTGQDQQRTPCIRISARVACPWPMAL